MSDAEAAVSGRRRISLIWLVPIVALLLGVWMVVYTIQSQGPTIRIVFPGAEGIEAGKTKIRMLNVEVGLVESASIRDDLESVMVVAQLEKEAEPLLRDDTQFWVVRPRIGASGVSGLGTILSGGYIQVSPGTGALGRRDFVGLAEPPVTPVGTPGLHFRLVSDRAGSVSKGDPIVYKGFKVGEIESGEFDVETRTMHYGAFIEAPYDDLVTTATRFWNQSGITVSATVEGVEVDTGSLESVLVGGIAFGLPTGVSPGRRVERGTLFDLHRNFAEVNRQPYKHSLEYVVEFAQSVRGLLPGAPVEYRGIQVGQIERIMIEEMAADTIRGDRILIPVMIRLQPGRLQLPDSDIGGAEFAEAIAEGVDRGLRASLETGNLLTGRKYVALDVHEVDEPASMGLVAGYPSIPVIETGFAEIQEQAVLFLDKLNDLPLERLIARVDQTIAEVDALLENAQGLPASLQATLHDLREALDSVSADSALQEGVSETLTELDQTLESLRRLIDQLERQPNSIIFGRDPGEDLRPPSGTQ